MNSVNYAKGCNINDTDKKQFRAAIEAAKTSEYVVFVAGLDSTVEGEGYFLDKEADEKGGGQCNPSRQAIANCFVAGNAE